jgi:hypothetical protein
MIEGWFRIGSTLTARVHHDNGYIGN